MMLQYDFTGRAAVVTEPHSDLTLERRNAAADLRLGHAKQARGRRHAAST
jgi:hypothetical protein